MGKQHHVTREHGKGRKVKETKVAERTEAGEEVSQEREPLQDPDNAYPLTRHSLAHVWARSLSW